MRIVRRGLFNYWNAFCRFASLRKVVQARVKAYGGGGNFRAVDGVFFFISPILIQKGI